MQHDRLIYVQLKIALRTSERHCVVVAKHLNCDHGEGFALSGIDLSRHDGGARFVFRNSEFAETGTRTTSVPADIVPDLHQRPCKCAKGSAHAHHAVVCRECGKFVGSGDERLPSLFRDPLGGYFPEARISIEPSTNCGAPDG